MTQTHTGFCKMWNLQRGFGFLAVTSHKNERDVFCHATALEAAGIRELQEGDRVVFNVAHDERTGRNKAIDLAFADDVKEAA